ncbi:hypothetical protein [Dokdonella sp.]|uniref:hypothetical protein n=1 Tax=Dokdonella sp. TaxID=2291710 RepID=UPI003784FE72
MLNRFAFVFVAAGMCGCVQQPARLPGAPLLGAARALEAFGGFPQRKPPQPSLPGCAPDATAALDQEPAREVMRRIDLYASEGRIGADAEKEWFALYAAYHALPAQGTQAVEDRRTGARLSVLSLVAVLPEPAHWPAMRDTAKRIAKRSPRDGRTNDERMSAMALGLMFDALLNDTVGQGKALGMLGAVAKVASKERREQSGPIIAEWRERLLREAGTYDPIAEATRQLDTVKPDAECCTYVDSLLVDVDQARVRSFLANALFERRVALGFDPSESVLTLAQDLAKERPDRLARVQWGLVGGARALEFFYAMAALADCRGRACSQMPPDFDQALKLAPRFVRGRLLRPLIEAGEDEHAERLLLEASDSSFVVFSLAQDLQHMIDAGSGQRALDFARFLLTRNPSSPYWSSLNAFAYATDQRLAAQAYDLLARAPSTTPDLEESRMLLSRSIVWEPTTGNDVVATAQRLQQRLGLPVAGERSESFHDDPRLARAEAAEQLSELGVLEERREWSRQGLVAIEQILAETRAAAYGKDGYHGDFTRNSALEAAVRLLREAGRSADAEHLLLEELAAIGATCRAVGIDGCRERFASRYSGADTDGAARLLMVLYADAGRNDDARLLADRYPLWQAEDAAALAIGGESHPAVAIARSLAAAGEAERASKLLLQVLPGYNGTPEAARLFGQMVGIAAADAILRDGGPDRGMRFASAALAASGAGDTVRAGRLAAIARAERLYFPWRGVLDAILADAAAAAGDAGAAMRWHEGTQAHALAERANRYAQLGVTSRANAGFAVALAMQQPGDCIENWMLDPARKRGDHAQVTALLRRMAAAASADPSGGALGCLRGYLSLTPEELSVLRRALHDTTPSSPAIASMLPTVIDELDADCTLSSSADLERACFTPAQRVADTNAAYAAAKVRFEKDPGDADTLGQLHDFTRRSAFPSLYGGHMDGPPAAPRISVDAAERDGWALRLMSSRPARVPARIEREDGGSGSMHSFWSPVTLLADYWRTAFEAARHLPPPVELPAYPLVATRECLESTDATTPGKNASVVPVDPAVRAGLAIGSTEIIITAARLIEPGVHDPCTMCL